MVNTPQNESEIFTEIMKRGLFPIDLSVTEVFVEIEISDETFEFIKSVANIEYEFYGDTTYIINNLRFKVKKDGDKIQS